MSVPTSPDVVAPAITVLPENNRVITVLTTTYDHIPFGFKETVVDDRSKCIPIYPGTGFGGPVHVINTVTTNVKTVVTQRIRLETGIATPVPGSPATPAAGWALDPEVERALRDDEVMSDGTAAPRQASPDSVLEIANQLDPNPRAVSPIASSSHAARAGLGACVTGLGLALGAHC